MSDLVWRLHLAAGGSVVLSAVIVLLLIWLHVKFVDRFDAVKGALWTLFRIVALSGLAAFKVTDWFQPRKPIESCLLDLCLLFTALQMFAAWTHAQYEYHADKLAEKANIVTDPAKAPVIAMAAFGLLSLGTMAALLWFLFDDLLTEWNLGATLHNTLLATKLVSTLFVHASLLFAMFRLIENCVLGKWRKPLATPAK